MTTQELIIYETPWIAEYISFSWGQDLVARYIGWKVNRKLRRLEKRRERANLLKRNGFLS